MAVFLILCIACVVQALYHYPHLPDEVARHFDATGQPDAWGAKKDVLNFQLKTIGFLTMTFLLSGFFVSKVSDSAINLPNKDYWLSPERRQNTIDYLLSVFFGFGSVTMILLLDLYHQSIRVNLAHATKLGHIWISLGMYITIALTGVVTIYSKFSKRHP